MFKKNVQTEKERANLVCRVKIDIPNPNMELKPGMPAGGVDCIRHDAPRALIIYQRGIRSEL